MVLIDLDLLLHKIWIFYRYDISKRIVTQKQLFIQKFKVFYLSLFLLINLIRYTIYIFIANNGSLPIYYFDLLQYFGEYSELEFIIVVFESYLFKIYIYYK